MVEKLGPELYKFGASTTKESIETYGQPLTWATVYLINKTTYVDKSKLK